MPFLSLAPCTNLSHDTVIYLSYIQDGSGHYDALVVSEQVSETAQAMPKTNGSQSVGNEDIIVCIYTYNVDQLWQFPRSPIPCLKQTFY